MLRCPANPAHSRRFRSSEFGCNVRARLAVYCRLYTVYDKCYLNTGQLSSGGFARERRSRSPASD